MNAKSRDQAVPIQTRKIILNPWNEENSIGAIAKRLCVAKKTILNIINEFVNENRLVPKTGGNYTRTAITDTNIIFIEYCKNKRPSVYAKKFNRI